MPCHANLLQVRQTSALDHTAELLGVSQEALVTALTTRRIVAPGEVVIKLLKVRTQHPQMGGLAWATTVGGSH